MRTGADGHVRAARGSSGSISTQKTGGTVGIRTAFWDLSASGVSADGISNSGCQSRCRECTSKQLREKHKAGRTHLCDVFFEIGTRPHRHVAVLAAVRPRLRLHAPHGV